MPDPGGKLFVFDEAELTLWNDPKLSNEVCGVTVLKDWPIFEPLDPSGLEPDPLKNIEDIGCVDSTILQYLSRYLFNEFLIVIHLLSL